MDKIEIEEISSVRVLHNNVFLGISQHPQRYFHQHTDIYKISCCIFFGVEPDLITQIRKQIVGHERQ